MSLHLYVLLVHLLWLFLLACLFCPILAHFYFILLYSQMPAEFLRREKKNGCEFGWVEMGEDLEK